MEIVPLGVRSLQTSSKILCKNSTAFSKTSTLKWGKTNFNLTTTTPFRCKLEVKSSSRVVISRNRLSPLGSKVKNKAISKCSCLRIKLAIRWEAQSGMKISAKSPKLQRVGTDHQEFLLWIIREAFLILTKLVSHSTTKIKIWVIMKLKVLQKCTKTNNQLSWTGTSRKNCKSKLLIRCKLEFKRPVKSWENRGFSTWQLKLSNLRSLPKSMPILYKNLTAANLKLRNILTKCSKSLTKWISRWKICEHSLKRTKRKPERPDLTKVSWSTSKEQMLSQKVKPKQKSKTHSTSPMICSTCLSALTFSVDFSISLPWKFSPNNSTWRSLQV